MSLCLSKRIAMKTYRGYFKPCVLDEGDRSTSCHGHFIPGETERPVSIGQETDRSLGYMKKWIYLLQWRWLQQVPPKSWYLSTGLGEELTPLFYPDDGSTRLLPLVGNYLPGFVVKWQSSTVKTEAENSSETLVPICKTKGISIQRTIYFIDTVIKSVDLSV